MKIVKITTTLWSLTIELDDEKAPKTVENFLSYAQEGFYDGTIFHRIIPGFMVQGGGMTPEMIERKTKNPIPHEGANGLKNLRGTIAMARTNNPVSATSQFFINVVDNAFLDFSRPAGSGWGYAVFGRVTEGIEIVDEMTKVSTTRRGGHDDVPRDPITIDRVEILDAE